MWECAVSYTHLDVYKRQQMQGAAAEITALREQKAELLEKVSVQAKALSEYRSETLQRFTAEVTEQLEFLNMPNVVLTAKHTTGKLTDVYKRQTQSVWLWRSITVLFLSFRRWDMRQTGRWQMRRQTFVRLRRLRRQNWLCRMCAI